MPNIRETNMTVKKNNADRIEKKSSKKGLFNKLFALIRRYPIMFVMLAFLIGLSGVPITDEIDRTFSSNAFCATTCHVMEGTVYKELQKSKHWTNSEGVQPKCADCHLSDKLVVAMWQHVKGTNDLISRLFRGIETPDDFETIRAKAANKVRLDMLANGSENCLSCHVMASINPQRKRGQKQHKDALKQKTPCIACHYNLVHKEVEPSEEFMKATENM